MNLVLVSAALPSQISATKMKNPLLTNPVTTFEESYQRKVAYTGGMASTSCISVASKARLVVCRRDTGVGIWRILEKSSAMNDEEEGIDPQGGGWEKVLEMDFNLTTNLILSGISPDGHWLVVSDAHETKLFALEAVEKAWLMLRIPFEC